MGGLGLGSYLASRSIDNIKHPMKLVRTYGILEIIIGAYCIILPVLLRAFQPLYSVLYNQLFDYFMFYSILTFLGCSFLLVIPATCMGATLPILCRFYVTKLDHLGSHAGRLYGINTIGAAAGSLLCGFYLIDRLGVSGSLLVAVIINGIIGLSCIGASTRAHRQPVETETKPSGPHQGEDDIAPAYSRRTAISALIIFGISGFCAMAYEVIWTKLLGLVAGPTTYSFTLVLVTFITCLALGSMVFGWLGDRLRRPIHLLLTTQCLAALFALLVSQLLGNSQLFFAKLLSLSHEHFVQMNIIKALSIFGFMFCPTFLLGATFPLVGKIYTQSVSRIGRSIGFAYAINTIGAVLGSFCAGFLLIPMMGKEHALSLVVALQILTCLVIATMHLTQEKKGMWTLVPLSVPALVGLCLCFYYPLWNHNMLSTGMYHRFDRINTPIDTIGWYKALIHGAKIVNVSHSRLVYYADGIGGFTTVLEHKNAIGDSDYYMNNSGKPDASTAHDMSTQTLLAHFPLLFHPDPRTVMVLGLASGITAGEVLHYPIERVDVLEISPQVVEGSEFFRPWNNHVLSHPKTDLIIQDGRAHLQLTDRTYDVIISEPSNPWMAGLATLFTREFFELVKDRLNDGGIFAQFFHSYEMDWTVFSLFGRTFAEAFPNSLYATCQPGVFGPDFLFVGFKEDKRLVLENAQRNLPFAQRSPNIRLSDPKLLYRLVLSEDLKSLFDDGPMHTDNRPRLEFAAPKLMYITDSDVVSNLLQKGLLLTQKTVDIRMETMENIDSQIDFAAYALSVRSPYEGMVDLTKASPEQKDRFYKLMEAYAQKHQINYSLIEDQEVKQRCLSVQMATLQQRIETMPDNDGLMQSYLHQLQSLTRRRNNTSPPF
jgi:spermidine synthase